MTVKGLAQVVLDVAARDDDGLPHQKREQAAQQRKCQDHACVEEERRKDVIPQHRSDRLAVQVEQRHKAWNGVDDLPDDDGDRNRERRSQRGEQQTEHEQTLVARDVAVEPAERTHAVEVRTGVNADALGQVHAAS